MRRTIKTESLAKDDYKSPDTGKIVSAFVICGNGEAALLLVAGSEGDRPDSIVIAHDDDLDGVFEDTGMNWFNVEPEERAEIGQNLLAISKSS